MRTLLAWTVASSSLLFGFRASAEDCSALADEPNSGSPIPKLYIESGDTQEPLLKHLGKQLLQSATKVRIIYRKRPTCELRDSLFNGAKMTAITAPTARPVNYIPVDPSFDPSKAAPVCDVPTDASAAQPIVLGIGATYLTSCAAATKPADIGVLEGPVQAYGFVTHKDNTAQDAITAEEGYLAYGFSEGGGGAAPWTVQNLRFKRGNTASTTLTIASAIHLLPSQMKAAPDSATSDALLASVIAAGASNPSATLGILGTELYDQHRDDIKLLAFKAFGQRYAYFPDSTKAARDKENVRDGHYLPWSPTPYITKMNGSDIADPNVKRLYELVMGTRIGDDVDGLKQVVDVGLVPKCAMKVARAGDGADLSLYDDPQPCGCYFEKSVPQGTTMCTACTNDDSCGGGRCRFGFCEAR